MHSQTETYAHSKGHELRTSKPLDIYIYIYNISHEHTGTDTPRPIYTAVVMYINITCKREQALKDNVHLIHLIEWYFIHVCLSQ